jgi:hypothetical protein
MPHGGTVRRRLEATPPISPFLRKDKAKRWNGRDRQKQELMAELAPKRNRSSIQLLSVGNR